MRLTSLLIAASCCAAATAATYHVAADGDDARDGRSPATAWRSLDRVSAADLQPGDQVQFRRGDSWRGSLRPRSGSPAGVITYGAYGTGAKPRLLGSVDRSRPADWRDEGGGVWSTGHTTALPPVLPADAPRLTATWLLHREGEAQVKRTGPADGSAPQRIEIVAEGKSVNQIQLICGGLALEAGQAYRLAFRIQATQPCLLNLPTLMTSSPPFTGLARPAARRAIRVGAEPTLAVQHYVASTTTPNARVTLYLGLGVPTGTVLTFEPLSWAPCPLAEIPPEPPLPVDVGNIIVDGGPVCGHKVWRREDLTTPLKYWYDPVERVVYLRCDRNPAALYRSLECALNRHIIDESGVSYATYQDLDLRYGAAHGVGGGSTHHITVRDCDISYIGGADQYGGTRQVRFGNGVEFWGGAHDNLVEGCRIWQVYDAALTNQNKGATVREVNLVYRRNIIWDSEYSFEYWNAPETSETADVWFVHNTCYRAGGGWGHSQRPNPNGRHLCFYNNSSQLRNLVVKNNLFIECTTNACYAPAWKPAMLAGLVLDRNLWWQPTGPLWSANGQTFTQEQFAAWQAAFGLEPNSRVGQPGWVDPANGDFRLTPGSPAIDAGEVVTPTGWPADPPHAGAAPDLGAIEYRPAD